MLIIGTRNTVFSGESYFCSLNSVPLKVYSSVDDFPGLPNAVVTIGTFDGVHTGHMKIIHRLNEVARETGGETVVLTFFSLIHAWCYSRMTVI